MVRIVERKVRTRAQQLYESRGQQEGQELQDWYQAESEVLENSILAPLYKRTRASENASSEVPAELIAEPSAACETGA